MNTQMRVTPISPYKFSFELCMLHILRMWTWDIQLQSSISNSNPTSDVQDPEAFIFVTSRKHNDALTEKQQPTLAMQFYLFRKNRSGQFLQYHPGVCLLKYYVSTCRKSVIQMQMTSYLKIQKVLSRHRSELTCLT